MTDRKSYLGAVEQSEEAAGLYDRPVQVKGAEVVGLQRHGLSAVLRSRNGQVVVLDRFALDLAAAAFGLRVSVATPKATPTEGT